MRSLEWWLVARVQRGVGAILIVGVLLGGIFPVLYGDLLPHEHLFLGAAPPPNWEQHEHPNPVLLLLGRAGAVANGSTLARLGRTSPPVAQTNRVISVYSGVAGIIAFVAALDVTFLAMRLAALLTHWTTIELAGDGRQLATARGPAPPPPRTS
jgi:hypothetical protein